jgi:hypothetical protein
MWRHFLVGEIYLALGQLRLKSGPGLALSSITEKIHDDGAFADGLINFEKVLAGNPAVLYRIFPRLAVLPNTDDDIETVVAKVQTLAMALGAIADESEGVVLEVILWLW